MTIVFRERILLTDENMFSPNTAITRADFLMALGRLEGSDVSGFTRSSFTDVPNNSPAMPYIEWATQNGIVSSVGNNQSPEETGGRSPFPPQAESMRFAPNDVITRRATAYENHLTPTTFRA